MPVSFFQPQKVVHELVGFTEKLSKGAVALGDLGKVDVGASSKDRVYAEDKMVLYRFRPMVDQPMRVPVLIVYALVNRPYMADLQEDRSLVRRLLEQGVDLYLIDWGYPDLADRYLGLDDYIGGYLRRCVDYICEQHGVYRVNLLGICQGGTFSACFSALYPERVRNLITMVTPVDFHTENNLLGHWARHIDVDLLVDTLGNVPGELLNWTFLSLKPFRLTGQKYIDLVDMLDDRDKLRNFVRMEKWIFDSPDQAGEAFRQFIKDFYQGNALVKGELSIGGQRVDLKKITMPVFNVYATQDHLVPPESSLALQHCVGTDDYTVMPFKGGHIGIYVSARAQKEIPTAIAAWLKERS
jgi:polyhydroxyalkanoate synthase